MTSAPVRQPPPQMRPEFEADLVSVIIPTFRRAHMIGRVLDSVRSQSYRPIEVLVVDDGSGDDTGAVVRQWAQAHESDDLRVRLFELDHGGAPRARNTGLAHSAGEFIQFLDSDDQLCPDKWTREVRALKASGLRYVWSAFAYTTDPGNTPCAAESTPPRIVRGAAVPSRIIGLYRRSLCLDVGPWDERLRRFQDWEYNARVAGIEAQVVSCSGIGYVILTHDGARIDDVSTHANYEAALAACDAAASRCEAMPNKLVFRDRIARAYVNAAVRELQRGDAERFRVICARAMPLASRQRRFKLRIMGVFAGLLGARATLRIIRSAYR